MHGFLNKIKFEIKPSFCIYLAFLFLFVPLKWVLAWAVASGIHELFHYAAITLLKHKVYRISIGMAGIDMQTECMQINHELACALAGPVGGFLLVLLARWVPEIALCACIQSLYNLIPIYPLDGGRAIKCVLTMVMPECIVCKVVNGIEKVILIAILGLTVYAAFHYNLGFIPILVVTSLLFKLRMIKIPCKRNQLKVQ